MELISCEKYNDFDYKLTIKNRGIFKAVKRTYIGNTTVFHDVSSGARPNIFTESKISDLLWKWLYDNETNPDL